MKGLNFSLYYYCAVCSIFSYLREFDLHSPSNNGLGNLHVGVTLSSLVTYSLLYRHECFTGKYTSRKIHKNYIRDPSGVFSIILHEFIDDVILVIPLYYFIDVILSI